MTDAPTERGREGPWDRLRRRKVVQWGLLYVAGAWGSLQGLEYLSGTYDWPRQIQQLTTLALLIGLPIVLVLAWYHGDRGEQRVRSTELAILTMLLLVGGGLLWGYQQTHEVESTAVSAPPVAEVPAAKAAPDQKSIAVLPFVDMSAAKDQEYMSDGIAEELLNLLAKVPDLKVIARTSSFAFKGEKVEIAEIARKLNVAHVLEGSVRKSGSKLRITAQLIRTADSTHLWSETYDRPLDDIFAVQDEIAGAIVQALQIRLAGGTFSRRKGDTQNFEAYQLYLRAGLALNQYTRESLDVANGYLEQAIKLDPNYGKAWSRLANTVSLRADSGFIPSTAGYERAIELAQHALQLSPELTEAHALLQSLYMGFGEWEAAEAKGKQALALDPTNPDALFFAGLLSSAFGHWDEAERQLLAARVRDPLDTYLYFNLGKIYYGAGRFKESEEMYRKALELAPGFLFARTYLSKTLLLQGKAEAALAMVQQEADDDAGLLYLPVMLQAVGRKPEADVALQAQIARWADDSAFNVAQTYAFRGDYDRALQWLERARRQKDGFLYEITGEHLFKDMADDPRFNAFLRKMKLPEWPKKSTVAAARD